MTTSPLLSAERPPSDPVALRDWIAAREEAFARLTRSTLRRIVGRAGDAFTRSLDAGAGDLAAFDGIPMQWAEAVQSELMPELLDLYRAGALAALITAGGESLLAVGISSAGPAALGDWDSIVNYDALDYQAVATNRLVGVGDTIWSDVRQRTVTGLEAGWTNERMKDEIEGLGQFSEYRADTIARTEANAAYNGGNYDAADALGEYGPVAKTWSAFIDRRTRPSHAQANEQTVAFAEPFIVGGTPMDRPHDPLAPAEEVVNCRCRVLFLFDGDTDPSGRVWTNDRVRASPVEVDVLDGTPTPATPDATPDRTPERTPDASASTTATPDVAPSSQFGPGPAGVQRFEDLTDIQTGTRGRLAERTQAMRETTEIMDSLHGASSSQSRIEIALGGKTKARGGKFSPATRGPKPKRVRGMSIQERLEQMREYNSRPLRARIQINDSSIDKQMFDLTHELGHAIDWDGTGLRSRRLWNSQATRDLQRRYGKDWLDHLDEIADEETRLIAMLGREVRQSDSVRNYVANAGIAYREYFTSVEEVWARAYSQWVAEASQDSRLLSALATNQRDGYQFSNAEFARIRPIIERILRVRGLMAGG